MAEDGRQQLLIKRASYGYWTAFAGLALQLVGVVWDALQHHFDPTLATKESVFSLTNPSHLLIVSGMGLAVVGVAWGMFYVSGGRAGFGLFRAPTLSIAILVALSLAASGTAIATAGLSGRHEHHPEEANHQSIGQSGHAHPGSSLATNDPLLIELKEVLSADGTKTALGQLKEAAAKDEDVEKRSHQYAHELGRFSYSRYGGDAARAFSLCEQGFTGGCYHGVLEAYLADNPDLGADDLAGLCENEIDASATGLLKWGCLHGMGHGLMLFFDHDLLKSLSYCDSLKTGRDQWDCYTGVFMENIDFAQSQHERQGEAARGAFLSKEGLHYPCSSLADKYKWACYLYQADAFLFQNGRDLDKAFEECEKAPKTYVAPCYEGLGIYAGTHTLWDPDESRELCMLGSGSYRNSCFAGATGILITANGTTDEAVDFCAGVPEEAKSSCFERIGQLVPGLHADTASRREDCEKAKQNRWVTVCQRSAGLSDLTENNMLPGKVADR